MKKFFDAMKIFVTGIFLCGIIFINGNANAAESNEEAMQIFRETILQTARFDGRVFHQDILFVVPRFTGELDFLGATEKDSLKLNGNLEFWIVDDKGNEDYEKFPFYLVQDSKNMTLYFQDDKKWKKMTTPVAAANFVDMFATPNAEELDKIASFVKEVTVLQESEKYRTLLVKIDCEKLVDEVQATVEKDADAQKQLNDESVSPFLNCLETGFRNADIWYTWTVNKTTWQTDTLSFNLSNLIQSIANAALDDPSTESMPEIRELLETVAFYSDFKGYTTFLNPAAKLKLEIPQKVFKAKEVESFSEDDSNKK